MILRIIFVLHTFFPESHGGTEKFVLNLARVIQKKGHYVKVITSTDHLAADYDHLSSNISIKEYTYDEVPVLAFKQQIPRNLKKKNWNRSLGQDGLTEFARKVIIEEKPDIVHIAHPMRVSQFLLVSNQMRVPIIVSLTDFFFACPKGIFLTSSGDLCFSAEQGNACLRLCPDVSPRLTTKRFELAHNFLSKANYLVSPSLFLANKFISEFKGINIDVIHHGIHLSEIRYNERIYSRDHELVFCYAGSLSHHKGVHVLIEAFMKISYKFVKLKIYGKGQSKKYVTLLKQMAKEDERIEFCGVYSDGQVGEVFTEVDLIIVPSIWYENYPLVIQEALACYVPVIASNAGGMSEKILNGVNGFTFNIGDSNHLGALLQMVIDCPEVLNYLKSNIKKMVIPTVDQEACSYLELYHNNIKNKFNHE